MSTKNKSSGSQFTPRGVNQGVSLVAHETGLPIDSIVDGGGIRRLAVDANVSIQNAVINVDIDSDTDNIAIRNTADDNELLIETDGSITVRLKDENGSAFSTLNPLPVEIVTALGLNVELDSADGDNVAIHDNEGDELEINTDGSINVKIGASAGVVTDASSDDAGDGLVALTAGPDVIVSIPVPAGSTYNLSGWDWYSDRICTFRLEIRDGAALVRVIRATLNSGSVPGNNNLFLTAIPIVGAATRVVRITATRVSGAAGVSSGGLNGFMV